MFRILTLMLAISFVFAPLSQTYAADEDSEFAQLEAIRSFLSRTFTGGKTSLSAAELRASIQAGAQWLVNAQEESGHFKYEYVPYEGRYRADDNIVRQAGALYALGEILQTTESDAYNVARTMGRAVEYLESLTKEDEVGTTDIACITRSLRGMRCPLGATSLALIGTLSYVETFPGEKNDYEDLIEGYAAHILASQKENGGFRTDHVIGEEEQSDAESSFSNGEAILALVRYYEYAPDDSIREAIERAFAHLRTEPPDPNLHLWIMAALVDMHRLWPKDAYVAYAHSFSDWRIRDAARFSNPTRNYCAYSEGLASALLVLKGKITPGAYAFMEQELNVRNSRHYALQLTEADRYRILFENGAPAMQALEDTKQALGGFLTGDAEPFQRIDFTQHCITGYVHTLNLMGESLR